MFGFGLDCGEGVGDVLVIAIAWEAGRALTADDNVCFEGVACAVCSIWLCTHKAASSWVAVEDCQSLVSRVEVGLGIGGCRIQCCLCGCQGEDSGESGEGCVEVHLEKHVAET